MSGEQAAVTVADTGRNRAVASVLAVVLVTMMLYFGRVVFEPIAFVLFAMALVEPFRKAAEGKLGKGAALILTILLTLLVLSILVGAIVWSIGDIVRWGLANVDKFQSLYTRTARWLEGHDLLAVNLSALSPSSFVWVLQAIAAKVNYFIGFALVVFLFLIFGLAEVDQFQAKLAALDTKMSGWSLLDTSGRIAAKIRKYMLIRTLASVATGIAVFLFTLSIGLELAVAWGIISFVLNYIPYVGPLIAVILPVIFATAQFESWQMVVIIFGALYLIQFIIGNYLEPVLTGNALAISPFVMLFAFMIWDFLWGMPGAFIGLPVTIALFTVWEQNPATRWIADLMSASTAPSKTELAVDQRNAGVLPPILHSGFHQDRNRH
jgi:predicted PurR-regulated permease PerM